MTLEEYIQQKQQERIQSALEKAFNRTSTVIPVFGEKTELDKKRQSEELAAAQSKFNMYSSWLSRMHKNQLHEVDLGYTKLDKPAVRKAYEEAKAKLMHATFLHAADKLIGPGCVATSMDNYDKDCISNEEFAKNPGKYGFVKINNKDINSGDIVQFARKHMMMSNTQSLDNNGELTNPLNMRYSGSNGYDAVRKGSRYPSRWEDIEAYRFVGDKQDSLKWINEYNGIKK